MQNLILLIKWCKSYTRIDFLFIYTYEATCQILQWMGSTPRMKSIIMARVLIIKCSIKGIILLTFRQPI